MIYVSMKKHLIKFYQDYLSTRSRKIEFLICLMLNVAFGAMQYFSTTEQKPFIGQAQGFVAVYLAFRFGIPGTIVGMMSNSVNLIFITIFLFTNYTSQLLVGMIFYIANVMWIIFMGVMSNNQELQKRNMRKLAITDDLTGVYNLRFFNSTMENEIKNISKNNMSIGLILLDIDNFRMYNDLNGYEYGDRILKRTAMILKEITEEKYPIFRFSGDEFAILVRSKSQGEVEKQAKIIFDQYEKAKHNYLEDDILHKVTFSMGLSEYPRDSKTREEFLSHAEMALYQAKNMGEDKINFYQDVMLKINKDMKSDQQMIGIFKGILITVNAKDRYTIGHSERVASYATMIGEAMGLRMEEIQTLQYAGLLHDIGKIEVPKMVLNKPGRLTDEEFTIIKQHPVNSASILEPLSGMTSLIDYVKHHHERYDGRGYPDGLSGEKLSLGARILCVADSFDAMVSERPYKKGMSIEEAFIELEKCAGFQFDPRVTRIFIDTMRYKMSIKYNYKVDVGHLFDVNQVLERV